MNQAQAISVSREADMVHAQAERGNLPVWMAVAAHELAAAVMAGALLPAESSYHTEQARLLSRAVASN